MRLRFRPLSGACLLALAAVLTRAADVAPRMLLLDGAVGGGDVIAIGERGTVLRSSNNAKSWQAVDSTATATLTGLSFADAQHGWAVGHDALILATTDGGRTWRKQWQGENLQDSFLDVLALDPQHVIAVGAYGLFCITRDGGATWTRRKILDDDYHLNRLTRGPTGTLYLAGEHGTLLRSTDRGDSWQKIESPYDGSFYGILPLGPQTLLAHGLRGRLYRSTDDGREWKPVASNQLALLATATRLKSGALVIAGQARVGLVSRDDGATFQPWATGLTTALAKLVELPDGTILALGEAGATVLSAP